MSAALLLSSCINFPGETQPRSESVPGYRELPDPCRLVKPETLVGILGAPNQETGDYEGLDPTAKSDFTSQECRWKSESIPNWAEMTYGGLKIRVRMAQFTDKSPDVALAKTGSEARAREMLPAPPELLLGDVSYRSYKEDRTFQVSSFYFRKANAEVLVEYRGTGTNRDWHDVKKPPAVIEQAAHAVAADAQTTLGNPH